MEISIKITPSETIASIENGTLKTFLNNAAQDEKEVKAALHQQRKENLMHYYICEICGANLDLGEKCECQEIEKAATTKKGGETWKN